MKIFLVEDAPHICERLKDLLEATGNHLVFGCADTYQSAIEGILKHQPDVGIFDIQLKAGSGIDALTEAKRLLPNLICIVLSNKVTPQYMAASAKAGATHVLDKSKDFERLPEILAALSST